MTIITSVLGSVVNKVHPVCFIMLWTPSGEARTLVQETHDHNYFRTWKCCEQSAPRLFYNAVNTKRGSENACTCVWFSRKLYRLCKVQQLIKFAVYTSTPPDTCICQTLLSDFSRVFGSETSFRRPWIGVADKCDKCGWQVTQSATSYSETEVLLATIEYKFDQD